MSGAGAVASALFHPNCFSYVFKIPWVQYELTSYIESDMLS